tara:strand:+ start:604 stop:1407 length:804 start_codon:yes stop_codon:yes gene_type:complete
MKKPFFISPPRTRSTILYESLSPYVKEHTSLLPLVGHSEPFLHTLQNKTIIDANTNKTHLMEMYPVMTDQSMDIHYVYPWIFKDNKTSVLEKLKLLKKARNEGNEYYIKGTYNISDAIDEVMDFFSDYDITLTLRHDVIELVCSVLFATHTKLFHLRNSNRDIYESKISNIIVNDEVIQEIRGFVDKIGTIYNLRNDYSDLNVVYYEDTDTPEKIDDCISNIAGCDSWKPLRPTNLPVKLDHDYSSLITNYDQIAEILTPMIDGRFK